MSEDAGINAERLEKLAYGGEELKPQRAIEVDMWDQECGTEGTVNCAIRRLTAQWGLPAPMDESAAAAWLAAFGRNTEHATRSPHAR